MSDIVCIRFVGGEEIMGDMVSENGVNLTIRDPAAIYLTPNQSGQMQMGLLPWLPYSENREFEIAGDKIITIHKPSIDLLNNYNRIFGSGIEIASAGALK